MGQGGGRTGVKAMPSPRQRKPSQSWSLLREKRRRLNWLLGVAGNCTVAEKGWGGASQARHRHSQSHAVTRPGTRTARLRTLAQPPATTSHATASHALPGQPLPTHLTHTNMTHPA